MKLTKRGEVVLAIGAVAATVVVAYGVWLLVHSLELLWVLRGQHFVG